MFGKDKNDKNGKDKKQRAVESGTPKKSTGAGKQSAKQPAAKKPDVPNKAARQAKPTAKKASAPKTPAANKSGVLKRIKHDEQYEQGTGGEKPIIINKKEQKKRASRRELRRVKSGGYTVFDGARAGKTFATEKEAANYAVDVLLRTGEVVDIARTDRLVTHTFKAEDKQEK